MSRFPFVTVMIIASALVAATADAGLWLSPSAAVCLQNDPAKPADDAQTLQKLLERINKLEAEVERLKNGTPGQPKNATADVFTLVDIAHVGIIYSNGQSRYVALHMIIANTTAKPITLLQDQITAEIDGEVKKLETLPPEILGHGFQYKSQGYTLQAMQPEKSRNVAAGGQASFWMVFPKLPMAGSIPKVKLKLAWGETKKEIDINAVQRAMLALETERIGPRGCLALMTIGGAMTMFNTQAIVDEMEKVLSQKVARVVLRWSPDAPQPEAQILNWLQNATIAGINRNPNDQFPPLPGSLREFHIVKFSENDNSGNFGYRANNGPNRIHPNAAEAVGAALRSAYVALPRDELLQEIREGHPLTRAAALSFGGARLDTEHLPLIYQWVADKNPEIQRAALQTLSHFGEPEAIEKLVSYVKRNAEPLSSTAVESLASSRYGAAHEALLELLKNEPPESKKRIVQVLAKYPRPVWAETLYEFANDPRAGVNLDAVKALIQVEHPKLVDILEKGLKGNDKALRDLCFATLSNRPDERSEKLATDYTLTHLKSSPPDANMTQLLSRTKDARAIPLLLDQLEKTNTDRSQVISLLVQIGDQTVAEKLAEKYPSLQANEKTQVLAGLRQYRHPKFREYAGAALLTTESNLVSAAANNLMQEGHPEGEKLLIEALDKQTSSNLIHSITNALANYGTPEARAALMKARDSKDQNKSNFARNALVQIRQRSPGYQYVAQGLQRLQMSVDPNDKDGKKQAEKDAHEFFELALQLDPQLAEAYAGRGKLYLRQDKLAEAGKDFEKAIELKLDDDSEVVTGLALTRVVDGKLDDAIKLVEDGREKFKNTRAGLYLYNTACVYSKSVEYLRGHKDLPDAEAKIVDYRKKSLADLEQAIKQGFVDYDWMAKDPDFKTLNDDPDFQKLLAAKPAKQPNSEDDE